MALTARVYKCSTLGVRSTEIIGAVVEQVTYKLNDVPTAQVSIAPLEPDAALVQLNSMELAIVFADDYSNIFQCIPVSVRGNTQKLTFQCEGVISYLDYAYILDTNQIYTNTEQLNIATQLVTLAQTPSNANRGIGIATYSASGVNRDRTYLAEDYLNIYQQIVNFTTLDQGFDWDVVINPDGTRFFTPYYPHKGSQKNQYAMELDKFGTSPYLRTVDYSEDGTNQVTDVIYTGPVDPTTSLKLRGRSTGTTSLSTYGRRQRVLSDNAGGATVAWLNAEALAYRTLAENPIVLPKIGVTDSLFNLLVTGDTIPLRFDYGRIQLNGNFRVMQIDVAPASDIMAVTLQPA